MTNPDLRAQIEALAEVRRAANDWHDATALWSVQRELDDLFHVLTDDGFVLVTRETLIYALMDALDGTTCFLSDGRPWSRDYLVRAVLRNEKVRAALTPEPTDD
jgi:hypothetical protein